MRIHHLFLFTVLALGTSCSWVRNVSGGDQQTPALFNPVGYEGSIGKISTSSGACSPVDSTANWCTGGKFSASTGDDGFNMNRSLVLDSTHGMIYVSDNGNNRILKMDTSGNFLGAIGWLTSSTGTCAASGAASAWCAGGVFTANAGDGGFSIVTALALDEANGDLYVADASSDSPRVQKIRLADGQSLGAIGGLADSTSGWLPSTATTQWTTGGTFVPDAGDGKFISPSALAFDATSGRLFVADSGANTVQVFDAGTGAFLFSMPFDFSVRGLAIDSAHQQLYTIDNYDSISVVDIATRTVSSTFGSLGLGDGNLNGPRSLQVDAARDFVFIVDSANSRIVRYKLSTRTYLGALGKTRSSSGGCPSSGSTMGWCNGGDFSSGSDDGQFRSPSSIAYDANKQLLYISDSGNNRVQRVQTAN